MADDEQKDEQEKDESQEDGQEKDESQEEGQGRQSTEDSGQDDSDSSADEGSTDDSDDDHSQSKDATPSLSAKEMTTAAIDVLRELTGREPEAATGLMWDGEAWLVTIDVLELARIPNTTDLLATYVVELDGEGNLSGYKRTRRFQRGAAEEG
jgi:hypothetical protein